MNTLIRFLLLFLVVICFLAINILVGVAILSMLIVPLTYLYSLISKQSYSFVIDQSNMLYKLNKFGQWSLVFGLAICSVVFLF